MSENKPTNREKVDSLLKQIETGTKQIFESDNYKNFLFTMSKFHHYSFRNCLLIAMQCPDASYVAGYQAWQSKFKRHVVRGEKGIQILAYAPYKKEVEVEKKDAAGNLVRDKNGEIVTETVLHTFSAYRPAYVYDISQTDGEPLPEITAELHGTVQDFELLLHSLREVSPFPIEFSNLSGQSPDCHGYSDARTQTIGIRSGMSQVQTVKTVIHEIAHARLHAPEMNLPAEEKTDRRTREVEAESIAFMVCSHYGIDSSDYTFGYLASWSSSHELTELQASLSVIQKEADSIIQETDHQLEQLRSQLPVIGTITTLEQEQPTEYKDIDVFINALHDAAYTFGVFGFHFEAFTDNSVVQTAVRKIQKAREPVHSTKPNISGRLENRITAARAAAHTTNQQHTIDAQEVQHDSR